jgi:diguanylate cyclase (GGDEF)-like protein
VTAQDGPPALAAEPLADPVTGAFSRALFEVRLREELERARRSGLDCSVCLFDVDHFKSVNDAFGHARGDQVLRQVAERTSGLLRSPDALFRHGGDEFVLLLPNSDRARAAQVGQRVVEGVAQAMFAGQPPLRLSVSLGVASYPVDALDAAGLVAVADRRSYLAKREGRARLVAEDAGAPTLLAPSPLLERDTAIAAALDFLARLAAEGHGTLRIGGQRGAGYTSFLDELARIAAARDFDVVRVGSHRAADRRQHSAGDQLQDLTGRASAGVLIIADGEASWPAASRLARERLGTEPRPAMLGLVLSAPGPSVRPVDAALPMLAAVDLAPLSPAAVRSWLRTKLRGEPTSGLLDLVVARSRGLPARVQRAVDRLAGAHGLERTAGGGWMLARHLPAAVRARRTLPHPATSFVGRGGEIDQLSELLGVERLVTLVGPGGIGKTRLAVAVSAAVEDLYDDGAVFVPLTEATSGPLVESTVAAALHVAESAGQSLSEAIGQHLANRELLLVLDGFGQVPSVAVDVAAWLQAAPGVTVLLTSHERLRLSAERVYAVPPLGLPDPAVIAGDADGVALAVAHSPALALFADRAQRGAGGFALTADNLPAVAELCGRLDGLPLAIELAAAWVAELPPGELLSRLGAHLDREVDQRPADRTDVRVRRGILRATIDWSCRLLDPADRSLLTTLGIFAGGGRLEAVHAVWQGGESAARVGERLAGLAGRFLLEAEADPDGQPRFTLPGPVRECALEQLAAGHGADALAVRHAAYYAGFAEQAAVEFADPDQVRALDLIGREHSNLRAALRSTLAAGDAQTAARIGAGSWAFWLARRHVTEGREWLDRILAAKSTLPTDVLARVLYSAGSLALDQGDVRGALVLVQESLTWARAADARVTMTQALRKIGRIHSAAGDYGQAHALCEESLALARSGDNRHGIVEALLEMGDIAIRAGKLDEARALEAEALPLCRELGLTFALLVCLGSLGQVLLFQGDLQAARPLMEEALALCRDVGDVPNEAELLYHLGVLADLDDDRPAAIHLLTASLALRHQIQQSDAVADSLEALAGALSHRDPTTAARWFGAAEALRERHELPRPPVWEPYVQAHLARLRDRLDEPVGLAAWAAGRDADFDEVITQALAQGSAQPR